MSAASWIKNYIKYEELEDRAYYFVKSRGGAVAMWSAEKDRFLVPSQTMNLHYLETEYHWDRHDNFGTVKPIRKLGMVPQDVDVKNFLFDVDQDPLREEFREFMIKEIDKAKARWEK